MKESKVKAELDDVLACICSDCRTKIETQLDIIHDAAELCPDSCYVGVGFEPCEMCQKMITYKFGPDRKKKHEFDA